MEVETVQPEAGGVKEPIAPAPPVQDRFLLVEIAAMRAKQLRRGARPRLESTTRDPGAPHRTEIAYKAERLAMEEVRRGLVQYELPPVKNQNGDGES